MIPTHNNKGVTVLEILVVITIIAIITAVVLPSLSKFRKEQTLNNSTSDIISLLNKARNDTISSLNSTSYGVHFETSRAVYFVGSVFDTNASTNSVVLIDGSASIPASGGISLNGGGSDVLFTRLTGQTTNYGTIIIRLTSDATRQKTITISKTGAISSN